MLLIVTKRDSEGAEHTLPLIGYTRDISETGLGLLIAATNASVLFSVGQEYTLQLVLTLPTGPIEVEAAPTRYGDVNDGPAGAPVLIGACIIRISDEDRARLTEYLRSFE